MSIWGPKVSIWTLTPNLMNYLAKQPKNISCLQIWFFFFIFSLSMFFGQLFWRFLTPLYAHMGAQGVHMDPNPEFYHLSVESARKRSLFIDSLMFFSFYPMCGYFE